MEQKAQKLLFGTVGAAGLFLAGANTASANTIHKITANDTVWGLSQKYGISVKSIEELNQIDAHSHLIYTGKTIQIPDKGQTAHKTTVKQTAAKQDNETATSTYQVKAGDSLWSIAQSLGTSVGSLRSLNASLKTTIIIPGQTLNVKGNVKAQTQAPAVKATATTPAQGSTPSVSSNSQKQTETKAAPEVNAAATPAKTTQTAQESSQPVKAQSQPQTQTKTVVEPKISANHTSHQVIAGESLYTIAQDYGVSIDSLREANGLNNAAALQVGQTLTVNDPTKDPSAAQAQQSTVNQTANSNTQQVSAAQTNNSSRAVSSTVQTAQKTTSQAPKTNNVVAKKTSSASTATTSSTSSAAKTTTVSQTTTSQTHGNGYQPSGNTYAWGQCTWYAKNRASWAGNYWGNGGQWDSSARQQGFTVNNQPAVGSLVVFHPGQSVGGQWTADSWAGHVAYVESVNGNTITISQGGMGFSNPGGPNYQTITNASQYNYIHQ
ncbi:hypothetical secreted protein [Ligilactobacillus salitolerans]|uniref:Hypothetical secreted protein n=1 Tax=Ligilactobacillus salitolerans TaxID=1808352 RepID=A0A401IVA0_9LACO|nr:hypothetical secreted protein [Ligilactobacillus salitolerans]